MRRRKNQMSKVTVEVENGSILWAQIMLQEGKCVTSDKLTYSDNDDAFLYLKLETSHSKEKQICLYGLEPDGDTQYYDWRTLEDIPEDGYRIVDITTVELKFIEDQMQDLNHQLWVLQLRKEKLLEKVNP